MTTTVLSSRLTDTGLTRSVRAEHDGSTVYGDEAVEIRRSADGVVLTVRSRIGRRRHEASLTLTPLEARGVAKTLDRAALLALADLPQE